jgi:F0F1-type ATP synthase assembly protein I
MEKQQTEKQRKSSDYKKKPSNDTSKMRAYAQYSSKAIQLGLTIALGAFIGRKLDAYFEIDKPYLTALLSLLATIGGIYLLIRDLINKK